MTRLIALGVFAVLATAPSGVAGAQTRRLSGAVVLGQVVDAGTGQSLARAVVTLEGGGRRRSALVDARGRFLFDGLPAGDFTLAASRDGYLEGGHGQRRAGGGHTTISLVAGQWRAGLDIPLWRPGVVTGDVRDQTGEPLVDVPVTAYRVDTQATHTTLVAIEQAHSDDQGRYRLRSLVPGDYVVGLVAPMIGASYYPGTTSATAAAVVTSHAGRETGAINFALQTVPLHTIRGHLRVPEDLAGQLDKVTLTLSVARHPAVSEAPQHRTVAVATVSADGAFRFEDVPSGEWTIEAVLGSTPPDVAWAEHAVTVQDRDLDGLVVTLQPALSVSGRVRFHGRPGRSLPAPEQLTLSFEPLFASPSVVTPVARVMEDGRFATGAALVPGPYLARVSGIAAGWTLRAVLSRGVDVSDLALDLSSGLPPGELLVELTDALTDITGTVRGAGALGDDRATVLAFPLDGRTAGARRFRSARAAADGTFSIRNLPPGSYGLVALDDADVVGWQERGRLAALRRVATPVALREGEARVLELRRAAVR